MGMQAYEFQRHETAKPVFAGDKRAVRELLRTVAKDSRDEVRVYLVQFSTVKADLLRILNGGEVQRTRLRAWRVSVRGRLVEIPLNYDGESK